MTAKHLLDLIDRGFIAVFLLLALGATLWLIRRALLRRWRGAEEIPGELQQLPPDGPRGVEVRRGPWAGPRPGASLALLAPLLGIFLLPACQSFARLADVAHRIYQAASDAEERAVDLEAKKSARACAKAGLAAERAAIAAQQALVDKAPGYRALKVAAEEAEKRMYAACDPIKIDGSSIPPPAPDSSRPADMGAAPDQGSGSAAPAARDLAPQLADGGHG